MVIRIAYLRPLKYLLGRLLIRYPDPIDPRYQIQMSYADTTSTMALEAAVNTCYYVLSLSYYLQVFIFQHDLLIQRPTDN